MKKASENQNSSEISKAPQEIEQFWDILVHMYEKQSTPHDHAELLADITKSLAKNDPEFNKIFLEHAQKGVEGMMDALETYSQKFQ